VQAAQEQRANKGVVTTAVRGPSRPKSSSINTSAVYAEMFKSAVDEVERNHATQVTDTHTCSPVVIWCLHSEGRLSSLAQFPFILVNDMSFLSFISTCVRSSCVCMYVVAGRLLCKLKWLASRCRTLHSTKRAAQQVTMHGLCVQVLKLQTKSFVHQM
jgi:hypothetical protein